VQSEIEKAMKMVLKKEVNTYGAARTDTGVNALNQYLNFYSEDVIDTVWLKINLTIFF